jgi:hypothetical protein
MNELELKSALEEHHHIYYPLPLIKELISLGGTTLENTTTIIKEKFLKQAAPYILNDYQLVDNYGGVTFKGNILIIDPNQSLYSNGESKRFDNYHGLGAIDALFKAIKTELNKDIEIWHYGSSAVTGIGQGVDEPVSSEAKVMTIIGICEKGNREKVYWGIGESSNALRSAVESLLTSINRYETQK